MLTLEQIQEILNVRSPLVYALVRSGELRAAQFGGPGCVAGPGRPVASAFGQEDGN